MSHGDDELFGVPEEQWYRFHTESDQGTRLFGDYVASSEAEAEGMAWRDRRAFDAQERRDLREREAMERQHFSSMNRSGGAMGSGNGPGVAGTLRSLRRAVLVVFVIIILYKILS